MYRIAREEGIGTLWRVCVERREREREGGDRDTDKETERWWVVLHVHVGREIDREREGGSCEVLLSFLGCIPVGLLANSDACYDS